MKSKKILEGQISFFDLSVPAAPINLASITEAVTKKLERFFCNLESTKIPSNTSNRLDANIKAIKMLRKEDISLEEQESISKYTGWKGLEEILASKPGYEEMFEKLTSNITDEEYIRAYEDNTLYSQPYAISAIWSLIDEWGFRKGNIAIVGNDAMRFVSLSPSCIIDSPFVNVTAAAANNMDIEIAKKLFPKTVLFEKTQDSPTSFNEVVVGSINSNGKPVGFDIPYYEEMVQEAINKAKPGGMIFLLTPKCFLDSQYKTFRQKLSNEVSLISAVRMPEQATYNGEIYDLVIFKKTPRITSTGWVNIDDSLEINNYYSYNSQNVIGEINEDGNVEFSGKNLNKAISNITSILEPCQLNATMAENQIPATYDVPNFSYTVADGILYYRVNSIMERVLCGVTKENRIKGMITIKEKLIDLIRTQKNSENESSFSENLTMLNEVYDNFVKKHSFLNARENVKAFSDDCTASLMRSIEKSAGKGVYVKGPVFVERVIGTTKKVLKAETPEEALAISINERGHIDFEFMTKISGISEKDIITALKGRIFFDPAQNKYIMADEYLSGNIQQKLDIAKGESLEENVIALTSAMPERIMSKDIKPRLGATWIPCDVYRDFVTHLLEIPTYYGNRVNIKRQQDGKYALNNMYGASLAARNQYGTKRKDAYEILQNLFNNIPVTVRDSYHDGSGNLKYKFNAEETMLAKSKAEDIKLAFEKWVFEDVERTKKLEDCYNEMFNVVKLRTWDGSYIKPAGMSLAIKPFSYQLNAIARILYSGKNALIGHKVGKGKTITAIIAAMEAKRMGIASKPVITVPNQIIDQWANEASRLYPMANILCQRDIDNSPQGRMDFSMRIATGDYDLIILTHSFFDMLSLKQETVKNLCAKEGDLVKSITGFRYSTYQLLSPAVMKKLYDKEDDLITFEDLGVDFLIVDESHNYKNLPIKTANSAIAGLCASSFKAENMLLKCRYINDINHGRGVTFLSGTPLVNSLSEMYNLQRFLDFEPLIKAHVTYFDNWAATFAEISTTFELAPEGTGYRLKSRFSRFYNLPELCAMFKDFADIVMDDDDSATEEQGIPEIESGKAYNIVIDGSDVLIDYVQELSRRADNVRSKKVSRDIDNMLCITNDGRKAALDPRLVGLEKVENSKINVCAQNVFEIYNETTDFKLAQAIFSDIHGSKNNSFDVYTELKTSLVNLGVLEDEICIINEITSDKKREETFEAVRNGIIRIIIGSTAKLGTGVNIQNKLFALHHLDCPWRPADLTQRDGRIIRQGNTNPVVRIYRYATKGSFDTYMWQTIENKQRFISQVINSSVHNIRDCEDIDETVLSYAEIKALSAADDRVKEVMELEMDIRKLQMRRNDFISSKAVCKEKIKSLPEEIETQRRITEKFEADAKQIEQVLVANDESYVFPITINGVEYIKKSEAAEALTGCIPLFLDSAMRYVGTYMGFEFGVQKTRDYTGDIVNQLLIKGNAFYSAKFEGGLSAINRLFDIVSVIGFTKEVEKSRARLYQKESDLEKAKSLIDGDFEFERELKEKINRKNQLEIELDLKSGNLKENVAA